MEAYSLSMLALAIVAVVLWGQFDAARNEREKQDFVNTPDKPGDGAQVRRRDFRRRR